MTKIKKSILSIVLGALAVVACALALVLPKTSKTVAASAETPYTTVNVPVFAKISEEYAPNGNFNLYLSLPQIDVTLNGQNQTVSDGDLSTKFNELNFFDNIMIGEKSLKELGCTGFWTQEVVFGEGEPQNVIRLKCHADPEIWTTAISAGEVVFGQSEMTVKKGALIPGYTYLSGAENPIVYRADMDYVARVPNPDLSYSRVIYGQTDVDSIQYTRGWNAEEASAYLGVSFAGDDYFGDGKEELLFQDSKHPFLGNDKFFLNSILVNGESNGFDYYGYFDLDEKGDGYYSFVMKVFAEAGSTITIPEGTLFPMRAINDFRKVNPHTVFMLYETQTEQTFYLAEDGSFYNYVDYVIAQLESYKAETGYFRPAEETQRLEIVANAKEAIAAATTEMEIEAVLAGAQSAIDALKTAAQYADEELAEVKTSARAEIEGYLSDKTYLSEQAAERAQILETGLAAIASATNETEIATAVANTKTALDGITPKQAFVNAAIEEITEYKADATYYDEQKAEKDAVISAATSAIQNAKSKAEIDEAVATAISKIDEVATIADILENYKAEALGKINEKKATVNYDLYLEATHVVINELYFNAKKAIKNANSNAEIDQAVETFTKALDEIPQIKLDVEEGCGNTLGMGAIFGVVTVLGGALLLKKGKNE